MKLGFLLFVCLGFSRFLFAETFKGELFERKTNFSKKLFHMDVDVQDREGLTQVVSVFKDLQGKVVIEEKGVFKKDELISFDVSQGQTQEKGRIEVQGDKVLFTYEKDGKKKTAQEKLKKPLLTNVNFNAFVVNNWKEIVTGPGVDVRFAVWFRLETVGFKIFKVGELEKLGQKWIQLRMKPSSFVIAALVDPLDFWYAADSKRLQEMSGRVSPKLQSDGSYTDLDCDVRYIY